MHAILLNAKCLHCIFARKIYILLKNLQLVSENYLHEGTSSCYFMFANERKIIFLPFIDSNVVIFLWKRCVMLCNSAN